MNILMLGFFGAIALVATIFSVVFYKKYRKTKERCMAVAYKEPAIIFAVLAGIALILTIVSIIALTC